MLSFGAMRTALALVLGFSAAAAAATPTTGTAIGNRVPAFTAQALVPSDTAPRATVFDSHATKQVTVYLVVGTTCPATLAYVERLRELERTYAPKKVDFVYVYPNRIDSSDAKAAFHRDRKLEGRMIDDQGAAVARALGARQTAEAILVGKDGVILYRGGVDDSRDAAKVKVRHLAAALDEHLASKPVTVTTAPVFA